MLGTFSYINTKCNRDTESTCWKKINQNEIQTEVKFEYLEYIKGRILNINNSKKWLSAINY